MSVIGGSRKGRSWMEILAVPATVDVNPEIHPVLQLPGTWKSGAAPHLVLPDFNEGASRT